MSSPISLRKSNHTEATQYHSIAQSCNFPEHSKAQTCSRKSSSVCPMCTHIAQPKPRVPTLQMAQSFPNTAAFQVSIRPFHPLLTVQSTIKQTERTRTTKAGDNSLENCYWKINSSNFSWSTLPFVGLQRSFGQPKFTLGQPSDTHAPYSIGPCCKVWFLTLKEGGLRSLEIWNQGASSGVSQDSDHGCMLPAPLCTRADPWGGEGRAGAVGSPPPGRG